MSPSEALSSLGLTRKLARWVAGLQPADLPPLLAHRLRLLTLDCLGAALYGRRMPWSEAVSAWALRHPPQPAPGLAHIWGSRAPALRPGDAALVNGTAAHAFELDDFHNAKVHPGAVVIPAVLALSEARGIGGPAVLTAIAAGYEVMIRLALALDPSRAKERGWHLTGICGSIGSAAAAARLLGLDEQRTAWALGLGGTQSAGIFAFTADGAMSKRLHTGRSAQSGVLAAELAELGFTGPTQMLEAADGGWLKTFCDAASPAPLLEGLGQEWRAAETSFKPYACCGSLHTHIDAALQLRGRWTPESEVRVGVARVVEVQCGYPYVPGSALGAQLSAQYCIAVALADGAVLPAQFEGERMADAGLTAIAQRVKVVHDPALDSLYPERFAGWVEVEEAPGRGRFRRVGADDPSGNPANARWEESLRQKFGQLTAPLAAPGAAAALEAATLRLGSLPAGSLEPLLAAFAERPGAA